MGGKVSLILVLGFSTIFGLLGRDLLNFSNEASDNFYEYYSKTRAHNIAVSGANMSANKLFLNQSWINGYRDLEIDDGTLDVYVDTFETYNRRIYSIGYYNGISDTVIVTFEPKNFAQYGNFYNKMAAWAATGDTFRGPFHTNDWLKCFGNPVFMGYTTTQKGVIKYNSKTHPEFLGGLETGVYIPLEFDTSIIRQAAYDGGMIFRNPKKNGLIDLELKLLPDGKVTYRTKLDNKNWSNPSTTPLITLAPNGVIYVEKGNVFIEGTLNGRLSVVASRKGSNDAGKIHITDDVRYNQDPRKYPESNDMLGLIAENYVQVDFNPSTGDLDIQASIYSQRDGLIIENYQHYPDARNMNLLGGIIGEKVRATALYKWDGKKYVVTHGYSYVHSFDERFYKIVPPFFPKTKYFKIVSWLE